MRESLHAIRFICLAAIALTLICFIVSPVQAQEPGYKFGAAGLGYFSQSRPNVQGWAAMGIPFTSDGKAINYTVVDISVVKTGGQLSLAGVELQFNVKTGGAYKIWKITNTWSVWGLAAPGLNVIGDRPSFSFSAGGFILKDLGQGWGFILPLTAETYKDAAGKQRTDLAPRFGFTKIWR